MGTYQKRPSLSLPKLVVWARNWAVYTMSSVSVVTGSVVDWCVSLQRRPPWKLTVEVTRSSEGGSSGSSSPSRGRSSAGSRRRPNWWPDGPG